MTREQLLAILTAALPEAAVRIVVVGSQSVLGAYSETELPDRASQSAEADVLQHRVGVFHEDLAEMVGAYFGEGDNCVLPLGLLRQGGAACGRRPSLVMFVGQTRGMRPGRFQMTLTVDVTVTDEHELLGRLLRDAGRRPELAEDYGLLDDDEVRDALAVLAPQMVQALDGTTALLAACTISGRHRR